LLAGFLWPVGLAIYTVQFTWNNGAYVRYLTSKGITRQIGEQLHLAVTTSMAPYWYYMYEVFEDHRRAVAPLYVQRYETKGYVYGPLQPAENDGMQDKARFARKCREAGVNAAPVLLELTGGRVFDPQAGDAHVPKFDIFVKPRIGRGGRNAERWDYVDGSWKNRDGERLGEQELLARLAALSIERDYIVQPRAVNHPDLNEVNNGALATVRVVTARNEHGGFEATDAAFRMAIGSNHTVDMTGWRFDSGIDFNFPAGTILGPGEYLVVAKDATAAAELAKAARQR
jgi:hypothetical protein